MILFFTHFENLFFILLISIYFSYFRKLEFLLRSVLERLSGPLKGKYYKLSELNSRQIGLLNDRNIQIEKPGESSGLALSGEIKVKNKK